ncbi:MAG: hypothetical protein HMLIMOIP_000261 [Candidatus Nitrosomirales archaeon]|jgi:hypothetical protein
MNDYFDDYLDSLCERRIARTFGDDSITLTHEFCSHISKVYYGDPNLTLEDAILVSILDFYQEGLDTKDLLKVKNMVITCFCALLGVDIRGKDRVYVEAALRKIFEHQVEDLKG